MSLSLCLTVKDEAAMLPRFLECARGLWDELVAVDTGSTDGTVELLQAAGAQVLHRPWTGDFSAARNPALESATKEWLLVLDPDEHVSPGFVTEVRALLGRADVGAATVRMLNARPGGQVHEARLLRLFRRHDSVRFRYPIHEDVTESVRARLALAGQRMVALESPVEHLGYARAHAASREKKARDVAILDRALEADPDDLYLHFKRLEQARFWEDVALWRRSAEAARAAVVCAPSRLRPHFEGELVVMVADGLRPGAPEGSLAELDRLAALLGRVPASVSHRRGELLERMGRLDEAVRAFEAALAAEGPESNVQLSGVRPQMGLVRLGMARGDVAAVRRHLEAALRLQPDDPEACLAAVGLAGMGGAAAVRQLLEERGGHAAFRAAAADWALLAREPGLAVEPLSVLAGEPPEGESGRRLALAQLAAGDARGARALALGLARAAPENALTVLLCDAALGESSELEVELDEAQVEAALRRAAKLLRTAALPPVLGALRAALPALSGPFPWLGQELDLQE
jgi:tetratricopeptide (TPR) repeat protein